MTTIIGPRPGEPDITVTITAPAPVIVPPPVDPPPSGNQHQATSSSQILALLARSDLGTAPVIVVPSGTVITPFTLTAAHGGQSGNRTTVHADGAFMDCGGGNSGIAYNGGHDLDIEGLAFRNGNFTQNAIVTFGYSGKPAATKRVALRRLSHDASCGGPARASGGTSNATAHFFYVSAAADGQTHDDILIEDATGHADDKGLAAFLHLYSGSTVVTKFVARRCTAYGYTQAVMGYAANLTDGLIADFTGIDCYTVLRLTSGSGRITNPKSSHPGSAAKANPLFSKSSGWTIDTVAGLG